VGERCAAHVDAVKLLKLGWLPAMVPDDSADWNYYEWNPCAGIRMAAVSDGSWRQQNLHSHGLVGCIMNRSFVL
jgi:hypothetical protein